MATNANQLAKSGKFGDLRRRLVFLLLALVVYRIGLVASGRPGRALLAPLLLSGQIAFVAYPMTGMETSFFAMLVTLSFHLFQTGEARTRAGSVALGFVLAALCMTRFDGFVLIGILAACPLLARRQWRRLLLPLRRVQCYPKKRLRWGRGISLSDLRMSLAATTTPPRLPQGINAGGHDNQSSFLALPPWCRYPEIPLP